MRLRDLLHVVADDIIVNVFNTYRIKGDTYNYLDWFVVMVDTYNEQLDIYIVDKISCDA